MTPERDALSLAKEVAKACGKGGYAAGRLSALDEKLARALIETSARLSTALGDLSVADIEIANYRADEALLVRRLAAITAAIEKLPHEPNCDHETKLIHVEPCPYPAKPYCLTDKCSHGYLLGDVCPECPGSRKVFGEDRCHPALCNCAISRALADIGPVELNPHPETVCQLCRQPNIVWFTDNATWNRVMGNDGGILCPMCFAKKAETMGILEAWQLQIEYAADIPAAPKDNKCSCVCHSASSSRASCSHCRGINEVSDLHLKRRITELESNCSDDTARLDWILSHAIVATELRSGTVEKLITHRKTIDELRGVGNTKEKPNA